MRERPNPWIATLWVLGGVLIALGLVLLGSSGAVAQFILGGVLLTGGLASVVAVISLHAIRHGR